jgi:hypothetical protein
MEDVNRKPQLMAMPECNINYLTRFFVMKESTVSNPRSLHSRRQRLRTGVNRFIPFTLGILAALGAWVIYQALFPDPPQLSTREVNDVVASVFASATPPGIFGVRLPGNTTLSGSHSNKSYRKRW